MIENGLHMGGLDYLYNAGWRSSSGQNPWKAAQFNPTKLHLCNLYHISTRLGWVCDSRSFYGVCMAYTPLRYQWATCCRCGRWLFSWRGCGHFPRRHPFAQGLDIYMCSTFFSDEFRIFTVGTIQHLYTDILENNKTRKDFDETLKTSSQDGCKRITIGLREPSY